ncbi:hypothetical protein GCM10010145_02270 [Streptomyces ruber]|uniref:Uncharacterized protein n=2 Tax=Streptomyces TaxID=1883 RepID=A0A918B8M1_9ACTN|nr:hypothetical protein GCM10010145_02270 [Streptomyces ruber]
MRALALRELPPPGLTVFDPFATERHLPFFVLVCNQMVTLALVPGPLTFIHQAWAEAVLGGVLETWTRSPLEMKAPALGAAVAGVLEKPVVTSAMAMADTARLRIRMQILRGVEAHRPGALSVRAVHSPVCPAGDGGKAPPPHLRGAYT